MKQLIALIAIAFASTVFAAAPVAPASAPVKTAQPAVQAQVNKAKVVARTKRNAKMAKAAAPKASAAK